MTVDRCERFSFPHNHSGDLCEFDGTIWEDRDD
jgi:hypothetical protein